MRWEGIGWHSFYVSMYKLNGSLSHYRDFGPWSRGSWGQRKRLQKTHTISTGPLKLSDKRSSIHCHLYISSIPAYGNTREKRQKYSLHHCLPCCSVSTAPLATSRILTQQHSSLLVLHIRRGKSITDTVLLTHVTSSVALEDKVESSRSRNDTVGKLVHL